MRKTGKALAVQESTASRNIAAIEQRLDLQVFARHSNGVRLTDEGRDRIASVRDHHDGEANDRAPGAAYQ